MVRSVLEFGAAGDGRQDDFAAIQAALDSGSREILIPQGIYCVSGTLRVPSNITIRADKTAKILMKSLARRKRGEFLLTNADPDSGNTNITITGGIWDGCNNLPENAKADLFDKNGYSGAMLNFVHVDGLMLRDMVLTNSTTYYVRMCRLHHFTIENIDFVCDQFGMNQDGLHFGGDVRHGAVKNIRALSYGQTNDDMIALNADDSVERVENLDLCRDDIEDISFENVFTENCHTIIRMLSVTASIRNIRFKNIYGGYRCNAVNADAARYCRTPLFRPEDAPRGVGCIEDISMENFTCYPVTEVPAGWKGTNPNPQVGLLLESYCNRFTIRNFRFPGDACALKMTNVSNETVCADGVSHPVRQPEDVLTLEQFQNLTVDLAE